MKTSDKDALEHLIKVAARLRQEADELRAESKALHDKIDEIRKKQDKTLGQRRRS